MHSPLRKALATLSRLPATVSVALVRIYQRTLSLDHGPLRHFFPYGYCRHEPTCSAYAVETLKTEPFLKSLWLIVRRVLSCNPWHKSSDERLVKAVRRALW